MSNSGLSFQPSCSLGGTWYACGNGTKFVGCCTAYPCTNTGCSQGNLRSASFLASAFGSFPDQECSDGKWYTCNNTKPSFLGCCKSNACSSNGCPSSDLRAGFLSSNIAVANQFKPNPPLSSSSTTTSSSSTRITSSSSSSTSSSRTSTTSTSTSSTSATSSATPPSASRSTLSTGAVAGAAVGGMLVLFLIAIAAFCFFRRRKRAKQVRQTQQSQRYFSGQRWTAVSQSEHSLTGSHMRQSSSYTPDPTHASLLHSPSLVHSERESIRNSYANPYGGSPQYEVHESDGRELTYMAYSPYRSGENSPAFRPDRWSAVSNQRTSGLGPRVVPGNSEHQRAELG